LVAPRAAACAVQWRYVSTPPSEGPHTKSGAVHARVQFAGGQRVSGLKPVGRHGYDVRYQATVTSKSALRIDAKDTVRIKLPGSPTVVRLVKLHPAAA
jgi:hypothetical protein